MLQSRAETKANEVASGETNNDLIGLWAISAITTTTTTLGPCPPFIAESKSKRVAWLGNGEGIYPIMVEDVIASNVEVVNPPSRDRG